MPRSTSAGKAAFWVSGAVLMSGRGRPALVFGRLPTRHCRRAKPTSGLRVVDRTKMPIRGRDVDASSRNRRLFGERAGPAWQAMQSQRR